MKREDAEKLEVGDRVEFCVANELVIGTVASKMYLRTFPGGPETYRIQVRRAGLDKNGKLHQRLRRNIDEIDVPANLDPVPANAYADWLAEHGELRAAIKLREAFPLTSR